MTIQFGEKLLNLSPSLAARIGLDEAVLAQLIFELSHVCPSKQLGSKEWFYLAPERWPELVPFWNMTQLDRIFQNLENLKVVERHFNENGQFLVRLIPDNAFNPAASQQTDRLNTSESRPVVATSKSNVQQTYAARQRNQNQSGLPSFMLDESQNFSNQPAYKSEISVDWKPDTELVLQRLMAERIPSTFIKEQLPDFVTYHMEVKTMAADWNSRFIQWVKKSWAKLGYGNTMTNGQSNPRQEQRDEVKRHIMDIHDTNW